VGFLKADKFYLDLGKPTAEAEAAGILPDHAVTKDRSGGARLGAVEQAVEYLKAGRSRGRSLAEKA